MTQVRRRVKEQVAIWQTQDGTRPSPIVPWIRTRAHRTITTDCWHANARASSEQDHLPLEINRTKPSFHCTSPNRVFGFPMQCTSNPSRSQVGWSTPFKASGRLEYPNPTRKRGTIPQVPHLRIGLGLVVFTSLLAQEQNERRASLVDNERAKGLARRQRPSLDNRYRPVPFRFAQFARCSWPIP